MGCTRIFVFIFVSCFIGWLLCDIDPNKTYTWYSGIWHGMFLFRILYVVVLEMLCIRLMNIQLHTMYGGG